jgi:hypothetical protein
VLKRLKARMTHDRRATGNSALAIGHYLDAALRNRPRELRDQIALAEAFHVKRLWDDEKTKPSTYRIGPEAYAFVADLKTNLAEQDFGRRGTNVVSAVVEAFLDALEAEGPLTRPGARQ